MSQQREVQEQRGLRFPFDAGAEVLLDGPADRISARVTQLSFRGCYLEISSALKEKQRVRLKIFHSDEYFETQAEVMYVKPAGAGLLFGHMEPHFRKVLQSWILKALDKQVESIGS